MGVSGPVCGKRWARATAHVCFLPWGHTEKHASSKEIFAPVWFDHECAPESPVLDIPVTPPDAAASDGVKGEGECGAKADGYPIRCMRPTGHGGLHQAGDLPGCAGPTWGDALALVGDTPAKDDEFKRHDGVMIRRVFWDELIKMGKPLAKRTDPILRVNPTLARFAAKVDLNDEMTLRACRSGIVIDVEGIGRGRKVKVNHFTATGGVSFAWHPWMIMHGPLEGSALDDDAVAPAPPPSTRKGATTAPPPVDLTVRWGDTDAEFAKRRRAALAHHAAKAAK